jgi:hypothetical protein
VPGCAQGEDRGAAQESSVGVITRRLKRRLNILTKLIENLLNILLPSPPLKEEADMSRLSRLLSRHRRPWRALALAAAVAGALGAAGLAPLTAAATPTPTAPPPVSILTSSPFVGQGDIFITPTGDDTTYANGPEILSPQGNEVWFHAIPQGQTASDFRVQAYDGQPVLTWWQGTGLGGLSSGTDYVYNDRYQQIAQVYAGNGLSADGHEFLITPWNTALILSYTTATANLTSIGGPSDQTVIDGVVQVPVGQRRPRAIRRERAAAAGLAEHAVGLVSHQRGQGRHRRQPADRCPGHLDYV